jgi:outer membrane lipoprotein LolB
MLSACSRSPETTSQTQGTDSREIARDTDGAGVKVLKATLATLNLADPVADLEANLAKQDKRFIGINGYTCTAPGIKDEDHDEYMLVHSSLYGLKCLAGTSDAIESNEHMALISRAETYARTYNVELRRRIRNGSIS